MRKMSREYQLLKLLLQEVDFHPMKKYAQLFRVSERTIQSDLQMINTFFEGNENTFIKSVPGKGIRLITSVPSQQVIEEVQRKMEQIDSSNNRQVQIICDLLLSSEPLSYRYFSDKFLVSRSSITADMKRVKRFFSENGFQLVSNKKGTALDGAEVDRQLLYKKLIEEEFDFYDSKSANSFVLFLENFFEDHLVKKMINTIRRFDEYLPSRISQQSRQSLVLICLILLERKSQGYILENETKNFQFKKIYELKNYFITKELIDGIEHTFDIQLTHEEKLYLNHHLISLGVETFIVDNRQTNLDLSKLTKRLIGKMSEVSKMDLKDDDELFSGLYNHLSLLIYRIKHKITVSNPLLPEIKQKYTVLYRMMWLIMSDFEDSFSINLSDDEIGFILIHFQAALERQQKIKKVAIICPNGIGTSRLLMNRIKKYLPSLDIYETKTVSEVQKMLPNEIDFIISTIPIEHVKIPVLEVSPLLTEKDILNMTELHARLVLQEEKYQRHFSEDIDFVPEILVFKEKFFSRDSLLDFLIDIFEEKKFIYHDYRCSVKNRELLSSTGFGEGVAIPHGNPALVKKSVVAILLNQNPVEWGRNKVDIVVLLAIKKDDIEKSQKFLEKLFTMMDNRNEFQKNIQTMDQKSLRRLFLEGGY